MGRVPEYPQSLAAPAWHDRCSAHIGGGAYLRELAQPCAARLYRVRKLGGDAAFCSITDALAQWNCDKQGAAAPLAAVIEIADNGTYHEALQICLAEGEHLHIRASNLFHPVLRMGGDHGGEADAIRITGAPGSRLVLDGLLVAGGGIEIDDGAATPAHALHERFLVTLRHTTLVPGWETGNARPAPWRGKPSVQLRACGMVFRVEYSVVGPIRVARTCALLALHVSDSIVDGGHAAALAITDNDYGPAPLRASFVRATIIGLAQVQEIALAEDTVFMGALLTVQRNAGRMRRCYLARGSRTPAREDCQPEEPHAAARARPRLHASDERAAPYGPLERESGADGAGMCSVRELLRAPPAVALPS